MTLLDNAALERSGVVANSRMNRDRSASGVNSYERELRFDPVACLRQLAATRSSVAWLDLCCGTGKALIEAACACSSLERIRLVGVDLVDSFHAVPAEYSNVRLICASLHDWTPTETFDLITCVHGLHYVGDKLGLVQRCVSWLAADGRFIASLDLDNLRFADGSPMGRVLSAQFKKCGYQYDRRKHLLSCSGGMSVSLGFRYLGADDQAGPNYSGQEAVNSLYCNVH